jgi:hypothetical protein
MPDTTYMLKSNPSAWKCKAAHDLPIHDDSDEDAWTGDDAAAATQSMLDDAKFGAPDHDHEQSREGFLAHDVANPKAVASYSLPIANMVDGQKCVTPNALDYAAKHLTKSGMPPAEMRKAQATISHYRDRMSED